MLCCSLVDCWLSRLSISMSRWDACTLLLRPFFSGPPPPTPEDPVSCEFEAGPSEAEDFLGGEDGAWSKGEEPGALFWWMMSSPFLLMAVLCGWAALPIIAHSLVWSTEVTRVEEEEDEEAVMDGCRTSISSCAENLRRRLWMQAWETTDSDWVNVGEWEGQKDKNRYEYFYSIHNKFRKMWEITLSIYLTVLTTLLFFL